MDAKIREFRKTARSLNRGRKGTAVRYGPSLRRQAVALARARGAQGYPVVDTARLLGLRSKTLYLWIRSEPARSFRRVEIGERPEPRTPADKPTGPTLVTRQGFRVEGLDVAALAALLRVLA